MTTDFSTLPAEGKTGGNTKRFPAWRRWLHNLSFEPETRNGKAFELMLILVIIISSIVVLLESLSAIELKYASLFFTLEAVFTVLFTFEYLLRLISVGKVSSYMFSFYGFIDIISILPMYLSLIIGGPHPFLIIRVFRLIRLFRLFKISKYVHEGSALMKAVKASKPKITVFLFAVFSGIIIMGALMYLVEGPTHGFSSIPMSVYWAIETVTTVGYGDIVPITPLGHLIAGVLMFLSYMVFAVFTGILSSELTKINYDLSHAKVCNSCGNHGHEHDAMFCKKCGAKL